MFRNSSSLGVLPPKGSQTLHVDIYILTSTSQVERHRGCPSDGQVAQGNVRYIDERSLPRSCEGQEEEVDGHDDAGDSNLPEVIQLYTPSPTDMGLGVEEVSFLQSADVQRTPCIGPKMAFQHRRGKQTKHCFQATLQVASSHPKTPRVDADEETSTKAWTLSTHIPILPHI